MLDKPDADRLELLDRIADRVPELDLEQHQVEWRELDDGHEALLVDGGGLDGGAAAIHADYPMAGGGQPVSTEIHLMRGGTATAINAQPLHRQQYSAAGSGALLNLDPAHALSSASLELTAGGTA